MLTQTLRNKLIDMTSLATYVKRFKNVVYNFASLISQNGFLISCIIKVFIGHN